MAAALAAALGGLAFACGSNDGPAACEGASCDAGTSDESSPFDASGDAADADGDRDPGADAKSDADAGHPPYTGNHIWSRLFGTNASSSVAGPAVAADSAGNIFVAGTLTGDADFGGGILTGVGADVYVAKFTKDGNHIWSKRFGDSDVQGAGQIAIDAAGNVFVGGNFNGAIDFGGGPLTGAGGYDIFVAKLDPNGNHLWSKSFGDSTYQSLGGLALTGSDIVLIGEKSGSVDFGGGALTARNYLVKLAGSNGAHVWSKQSTSGAGFVPSALTADAVGNIVAVGQLGSTLDWEGGLLTTAGGDDVLVIKFDSTGNALWSKRFGDNQFQEAFDLRTDAAGAIFVTGTFGGALDFGVGAMTAGTVYLAKLDKDGGGVWSKSFGTGVEDCRALAVDAFGNVAIAGGTIEPINLGGGPLPQTDGATNIFIGKFDGTGKHLWSKGWAAGGGGVDATHGLAFDSSGNLLFTGGLHQSTIDMGGGPLATIGAGGFLVLAKFAP